MSATAKVFLSYAREDLEPARRLYKELTSAGVSVWFDQVDLLPGKRWREAIIDAIRSSRYFLALLSRHSMTKRGYVQKELREALEVLEEVPETDIFLIPIRLEDCKPSHQRLQELQWVDLFPSFEGGVSILLKVLLASDAASVRAPAVSEHLTTFEIDVLPVVDIAIGNVWTRDYTDELRIKAVLDTGADVSIIPERDLRTIRSRVVDFQEIQLMGGHPVRVDCHIVTLKLGDLDFGVARVLSLDSDYALIGIDVLRQLVILYDGPGKKLRLWKSTKKQ